MSQESPYQILRGPKPPNQKMVIFYTPPVKLKLVAMLSTSRESPWCNYQKNPLGTYNYNFCTFQYQLCNINSPVILTQNCCGKRTVIPRPKITANIVHKIDYIHAKISIINKVDKKQPVVFIFSPSNISIVMTTLTKRLQLHINVIPWGQLSYQICVPHFKYSLHKQHATCTSGPDIFANICRNTIKCSFYFTCYCLICARNKYAHQNGDTCQTIWLVYIGGIVWAYMYHKWSMWITKLSCTKWYRHAEKHRRQMVIAVGWTWQAKSAGKGRKIPPNPFQAAHSRSGIEQFLTKPGIKSSQKSLEQSWWNDDKRTRNTHGMARFWGYGKALHDALFLL